MWVNIEPLPTYQPEFVPSWRRSFPTSLVAETRVRIRPIPILISDSSQSVLGISFEDMLSISIVKNIQCYLPTSKNSWRRKKVTRRKKNPHQNLQSKQFSEIISSFDYSVWIRLNKPRYHSNSISRMTQINLQVTRIKKATILVFHASNYRCNFT